MGDLFGGVGRGFSRLDHPDDEAEGEVMWGVKTLGDGKYQCTDGKFFPTFKEARRHERSIEDAAALFGPLGGAFGGNGHFTGWCGFHSAWAAHVQWMAQWQYMVWLEWQQYIACMHLGAFERKSLLIQMIMQSQQVTSLTQAQQMAERMLGMTGQMNTDQYGVVQEITETTTTTTTTSQGQDQGSGQKQIEAAPTQQSSSGVTMAQRYTIANQMIDSCAEKNIPMAKAVELADEIRAGKRDTLVRLQLAKESTGSVKQAGAKQYGVVENVTEITTSTTTTSQNQQSQAQSSDRVTQAQRYEIANKTIDSCAEKGISRQKAVEIADEIRAGKRDKMVRLQLAKEQTGSVKQAPKQLPSPPAPQPMQQQAGYQYFQQTTQQTNSTPPAPISYTPSPPPPQPMQQQGGYQYPQQTYQQSTPPPPVQQISYTPTPPPPQAQYAASSQQMQQYQQHVPPQPASQQYTQGAFGGVQIYQQETITTTTTSTSSAAQQAQAAQSGGIQYAHAAPGAHHLPSAPQMQQLEGQMNRLQITQQSHSAQQLANYNQQGQLAQYHGQLTQPAATYAPHQQGQTQQPHGQGVQPVVFYPPQQQPGQHQSQPQVPSPQGYQQGGQSATYSGYGQQQHPTASSQQLVPATQEVAKKEKKKKKVKS